MALHENDILTASIVVHGTGGNVPWIDPINCCAFLYPAEIDANADNPEVIRQDGVNHLVISVYPDHWHVSQVGGYTPDRGMYTETY